MHGMPLRRPVPSQQPPTVNGRHGAFGKRPRGSGTLKTGAAIGSTRRCYPDASRVEHDLRDVVGRSTWPGDQFASFFEGRRPHRGGGGTRQDRDEVSHDPRRGAKGGEIGGESSSAHTRSSDRAAWCCLSSVKLILATGRAPPDYGLLTVEPNLVAGSCTSHLWRASAIVHGGREVRAGRQQFSKISTGTAPARDPPRAVIDADRFFFSNPPFVLLHVGGSAGKKRSRFPGAAQVDRGGMLR